MNKKRYSRKHIGKEFKTNEGYMAKIIDGGTNPHKCTIEWVNNGVIQEVNCDSLKKGNVKNPYHKNLFGVGYLGIGEYNTKYNNDAYLYWSRMFTRCYSEAYLKTRPNYRGVTVCEEWHNFQNFAKWFYEKYDKESMKGWHLDKDILQKDVKNKVYSPKTCMFVSQYKNSIEANSRIDYSYATGENHYLYKDISYYSVHPIRRADFKSICKKRGFDFNEYIEIFHSFKIKKDKTRYKIYNYIKSGESNEN